MTELETAKEPTKIRLADERDEPEIWKLCQAMHAEQGEHPLDWSRITPAVRMATRHERGIIGVIGEPGDLKGGVFMVLDQVWYSQDWVLREWFNFVKPEARKSTYGKDLIAYAKSTADAVGVELIMGVFSSKQTEAKVRLYKRTPGFEYRGGWFSYIPDRVKLARAAPANMVAAE